MSNDNARDQDRAWELMKKIGFAMLVTQDSGKLSRTSDEAPIWSRTATRSFS